MYFNVIIASSKGVYQSILLHDTEPHVTFAVFNHATWNKYNPEANIKTNKVNFKP